MKNQIISLIIAFIFFGTFSCKKDIDLSVPLNQTESTFVPDYYIRGIMEDLVNEQEIVLRMDSSVDDPTPENIFDGSNKLFSNTGLGEHSPTQTKFIKSYTGFSETSSSSFSGIDADRALNGTRLGIGAILVSDVPINDLRTRFTREELLPLLQEGTKLSIGAGQGQIGIGFHQFEIGEYTPPFDDGFVGYSNLTDPTMSDSFEILKVEDYQQEGVENPEKGLLVTARINCSLGYSNLGKVINLVDVEVLFFFEHS